MPKIFISMLFITAVIFIAYLLRNPVVTTVKYFPIDDLITIEVADTKIALENDQDITWTVSSTSSEHAYLRQDISLLYENGMFKGVFKSWKQDVDQVFQQLSFPTLNNARLESISYHHAEVHHSENLITSAQKMTNAQLYIVKDNAKYHSFKVPTDKKDERWQEKLDTTLQEQLTHEWDLLMDDLNINHSDYHLIPLTDLYQYETKNFPNRTRDETNKILGKLWEGLYKNYIVLLNEKKNRDSKHIIPLILVAKDESHLLVIFELNNEQQKLMQQTPS